ncbi:MAG: NHLP family bacteriocin export ABC transporter peptidase/permease/ATPase subunit [Actinomycetota bacterium]|nr:NHLP family bacteriocin export ABC transporter peptidase/permease/ATPase subunit [Actinomycetota bacterium]
MTAAARPPTEPPVGPPPDPDAADRSDSPLGPQPDRRRRWRRVKTPTLLQMEAAECGAAALGIVLAYHGRHVPLEQLRRECGVSRDGASAASIVRAAKAHGLEAAGHKMEVPPARTVKPPFIAFWNLNHFLVVEGFRRRGVRVNDPAAGPRQVSHRKFDESFTGIVISLRPGPDFERGGRPQNSIRELRSRLSGSAAPLALVLLASLLLAVGGLALPGFQRVFIDSILLGGVHRWLGPVVGLMLVVALVLAGLTLLQQQYLLRLETKMSIRTSSAFLRHVLKLPIEFFTQRQASDIAGRVGSNDRVAQLLSRDLATATVSAIVAVVYALLLVNLDTTLAAIGIGLALLNLLALRLVARLRRDATSKLQQDRAKLTAATYNGISMIETIKATGRESDYFARWAGLLANVVSGSQRLGIPTQIVGVVPAFLATVNTAFILLVGSKRALDGVISIGLLIAFQTLLSNFTRPVADLSDLGVRLQEANADIARIRDVERYPDRGSLRVAPTPLPRERLGGYLELEDVSFGYSPLVAPFIEGFSLRVAPGQRIALVGSSGSGKTTVARLIAGLLEPWSGEIRIDGIPREQIPGRVLAASLAVVDQDLFLFEGTVRENLTLWDDTVPREILISAMRDAMILDDVMERPDRLDAELREDARDLSGGQRQRLEIARALAVGPTLLVLDEATSALDPATERAVYENIRPRGCACVIVAHRLSTIRDCDEILVMEHGRVVERGTHEQMKEAGGPYETLIHAS